MQGRRKKNDLGTKQSTRRRGIPARERHANRIVLCWRDMTDTEHKGQFIKYVCT